MGILAEDAGERINLPIKTPLTLFKESVSKSPDNIALICRHQTADFLGRPSNKGVTSQGCLRWTYSQLFEASSALAAIWYSSGIRRGMRIVTFIHAGAQYAVAFHAASILGCAFVPINPAFVNKPDDVRHMLGIAQASVVMVWDEPMAQEFEQAAGTGYLDHFALKIVAGHNTDSTMPAGWLSLEHILSPQEEPTLLSPNEEPGLDDEFLVIFSSGTTSKPKGVALTNRNWGTNLRSLTQVLETDAKTKACVNLPLFHVFGIQMLTQCWIMSATSCIPSATFSPSTTLRAIEEEKLTQLTGPPALLNAVIADPGLSTTNLESLDYIILGAAVVLPETVAAMGRMLRCNKVMCAFGMSEGMPLTCVPYRDLPYNYAGQFITAGKPAPGARVRICEPGSRRVLQRGEIGEVHVSGDQVTQGYLGGAKGEFYSEDSADGYSWLATGDQATMEDNGEIYIMGRYKDVVIRGGENIAPASLEAVIDTLPGVSSQVVGVPDEIAGEVPAAVIKLSEGATIDEDKMHGLLNERLGTTFVPAYTIAAKDLGLEDFPKTTTGKIQKAELKPLVVEHIHKLESPDDQSSNEESLRKIWAGLLGTSGDRLTPSTSMEELTDSITVMRALSKINKTLGVKISPQEISDNPTIEKQAQLIDKRFGSSHADQTASPVTKREGPPQLDDVVYTLGSKARLDGVKEAFQAVATGNGLTWEKDVEDIVPIWDWGQVMLRRLRAQSWNHRHAYATTKASPTELRKALETALARQPMLRTLAVNPGDGKPLHAIIRPSSTWFDLAITEVDGVETPVDLRKLVLNDAKLDFAASQGPLFRAIIAPIAETGTAGLVYHGQHSCFDAISLPNLIEDLGAELRGVDTMKAAPRVSYKLWADNYFLHRTSALAKADCDFHVQRLRGIGKLSNSLWPRQRAPGWFKGNDTDVQDLGSTSTSGLQERKPLDGKESIGVDGVSGETALPHLQTLRQQHGFSAPSMLKTALAILNSHYTREKLAIFVNYEAGRDWPFQGSWIADMLPNAMDVNGPTLQAVLNNIAIDPEEKCLDLFQRVHEEQVLLTEHAHAPLLEIQKQLGPEDGVGLVDNVMRRQIFNWLPGLKSGASGENDSQPLERVQMQSRSDVGILWNCGMVDQIFHLNASYDDAQLYKAEVEEIVGRYFEIAAWMTDPEHLENSVGQCPAF